MVSSSGVLLTGLFIPSLDTRSLDHAAAPIRTSAPCCGVSQRPARGGLRYRDRRLRTGIIAKDLMIPPAAPWLVRLDPVIAKTKPRIFPPILAGAPLSVAAIWS